LTEIRLQDELLEQQEKMLVEEEESNQEPNKLVKLEKERCEKLDLELAQTRRISLVSRAHVVLLKTHISVLPKATFRKFRLPKFGF
jgi:hypothetical protein